MGVVQQDTVGSETSQYLFDPLDFFEDVLLAHGRKFVLRRLEQPAVGMEPPYCTFRERGLFCL